MSKYDYEASRELASAPFYALIMAAMRNADTDNLEHLRRVWPKVWRELSDRYNAPGGRLPSDAAEVGGIHYTDPKLWERSE